MCADVSVGDEEKSTMGVFPTEISTHLFIESAKQLSAGPTGEPTALGGMSRCRPRHPIPGRVRNDISDTSGSKSR